MPPDLDLEKYDEKQKMLILYMSDPLDPRELDEFCTEESISMRSALYWLRRKDVSAEIRDRLALNADLSKALILKRQLRSAVRGNAQAAKLFLEVTGQFIPTSKQIVEGPLVQEMTDEELDKEARRLAGQLQRATEGMDWRDGRDGRDEREEIAEA